MSYGLLVRAVPRSFLPLGFLARVPYAITPLGSLLLIQGATGSYSFAGIAVGAQSLSTAAGGVAIGSLVSRFGARRVGVTAAVACALTTALLILTAAAHSTTGMLLTAIAVGFTQPQVGPLVRVHWAALLDRDTATAFSYETAADEAAFIVGPVLVGLLTAVPALVPGANPLTASAVLLVGAAVPFATMYVERPRVAGPRRREFRPAVGVLVVGSIAMGAIFGTIQTAVTADQGSVPAGILYAGLAVGSTVAGICYAWLPKTFSPRARYLVFCAALGVAMAVLLICAWGGAVLVGIVLAGCAIAPFMISQVTLAETVSTRNGFVFTIALLSAGGPVGSAAGQALTGYVLDTGGERVAWALPVLWALLALASGVAAFVLFRQGASRPAVE
ncbi:MFS transporter [Pseudonocardia sp. TRM90224]|uniref:MFS transporter n=1 Tax=Pseudonocardia sp. TRM90224 TaxID=2812678 RepID=UPI001E3513E8|nr:MFS transporter [Pseudonocardia sp. TRM90224]